MYKLWECISRTGVGWKPDLDGLCACCRVRAAINTHSDFDKAMADLTAFFARLEADPPSGKPASGKRTHSTSAAQQSSGVAPGARSGKPHSSGPGQSGQLRKVADTAGEKASGRYMTLFAFGNPSQLALVENRLNYSANYNKCCPLAADASLSETGTSFNCASWLRQAVIGLHRPDAGGLLTDSVPERCMAAVQDQRPWQHLSSPRTLSRR